MNIYPELLCRLSLSECFLRTRVTSGKRRTLSTKFTLNARMLLMTSVEKSLKRPDFSNLGTASDDDPVFIELIVSMSEFRLRMLLDLLKKSE